MIKKIALLPLDGRPCNIKYPDYISKIAGFELHVPPPKDIGDLKHEGNYRELSKWLEKICPYVDLMVLSVDMLAFGGLVSSRKYDISYNEANLRLRSISKLKTINPKLKIFAFSEIMRLSVTAEDEDSARVWRDLFEFSQIIDRFESTGDKKDSKRLNELKKKIPIDTLDTYLKTRERNHEVNKKAVELVEAKVIDSLVLGVEDAALYGLHRKEKKSLQGIIKELNLSEKVKIINGADEISSLLIAKAKVSESGKKPKVFLRYINEHGKDVVSLYEDKPIREVLSDHINAVGGVESQTESNCDLKIYINDPRKEQVDIFLSLPEKKETVPKEIFDEMNKDKLVEKPAAVADIKYCNGADSRFVSELLKKTDYFKLASFSGYNTTANSAGLVLAHGICFLLSGKSENTLRHHREFMLYSLMNDYVYQAVVRPEIIGYLKDANKSAFDVSDYFDEVDYLLKEKMMEKKEELLDPYLDLKDVQIKNIGFPWRRLFEMDLDIIYKE